MPDVRIRLSQQELDRLRADAPPGTPLATHVRSVLLVHLNRDAPTLGSAADKDKL